MKDILLSVRPKWCEKICHEIGKDANGKPIYEKVIEVRKSKPSEVPFKCFIYATKKEYLQCMFRKGEYIFSDDHSKGKFDENIFVKNRHDWQSKVIGEFICDKITEYIAYNTDKDSELCKNPFFYACLPLQEMCLTIEQIEDYGKGKPLYGWHISDLKIYDKPRELSEFRKCGFEQDYERWDSLQSIGVSSLGDMALKYPPEPKEDDYILKRPPQSWCYVEEAK